MGNSSNSEHRREGQRLKVTEYFINYYNPSAWNTVDTQ